MRPCLKDKSINFIKEVFKMRCCADLLVMFGIYKKVDTLGADFRNRYRIDIASEIPESYVKQIKSLYKEHQAISLELTDRIYDARQSDMEKTLIQRKDESQDQLDAALQQAGTRMRYLL
jgi:hypothetical protein